MVDWNGLSPYADFLLHKLHYFSLLFMIVAYIFKVRSILKKTAAKEGTPAKGDHSQAIRYSYLSLAIPWEMESMRKHWFRYIEFVIFHIVMAIAIGVAFIMPWGHGFMTGSVVIYGLMGLFGLAALIGVSRLLRRIFVAEMRMISTPDDYFCVILLTAWMVSGVFAMPQTSAFWLTAFFTLATFFLFYVPFSKISHYVYWFFARYYIGKHFGHRGVYPKKSVANETGTRN